VAPLPPRALEPAAARTAALVAELDVQVRACLSDQPRANGLLLRGFDQHRELPGFLARYGLRAAAVAVYPMYRGIAKLVGMDVLGRAGNLDEQLGILRDAWDDYDFFFVHHKATDAAGEDGDRSRKIAAIEEVDAAIPAIRALRPDVLMVSGDHSTPSQMAAHSWHPVPIVLHGPNCGRDDTTRFGERWCRHGALGPRPMKTMMPILLANAGRLTKYGA
jgi:2,3-bisphosphoglycerate-independent phosphoglycerate mutase